MRWPTSLRFEAHLLASPIACSSEGIDQILFGPANGILLDHDHETVIKLRGPRFKSYADQFIPPLIFARQHVGNVLANAARFLARDSR